MATAFTVPTAPLWEDPLALLPRRKPQRFEKDQTIYAPEDPADSLFLVVSGAVKVSRFSDNGRETVLDVESSESFFGLASLLGEPERGEMATALEPSQVMEWGVLELRDLMARTPDLGPSLMRVEAKAAVQPGSQWAERAYEAIAPVYDDFTAHHDYELWLGELLPQVQRHGLSGHRLLDVGCGTGKSFLPMLERGWEVTACDISPSMLELAREKAGDAARLAVADMRELPVFGQFDLVWALDDAVNYLLSAEEMGEALSGMRANLAPGGLLMFDVNTLKAYRTFFASTERVERGGRRLLWRGQASADTPPGSISEAHFEVEGPANGVAVERHVHRQRHFPEAEVLELIEAAGLECLEVFGHGYDAILQQPVRELTHTKVVYICCRA